MIEDNLQKINKNNIKRLWNIWSNVIRNGSSQGNYSKHFIDNNKEINNMEEAARFVRIMLSMFDQS